MAIFSGSRTVIALKLASVAFAVLLSVTTIYAAKGYIDALRSAEALAARADRLIAANRGAEGLGPGRAELLLRVEDPGFWAHGGVDVTTPGAGMTSLTQSLAKRLAFDSFRPGFRKIRQTTYAMGLEARLSKPRILALFLETVPLGRGPDGWMTGIHAASQAVYGRPPAALDDRQFLSLVAVMIAPGRFSLLTPDPDLDERIDRIERMIAGRCRPRDGRDVWLEGCASLAPPAPGPP